MRRGLWGLRPRTAARTAGVLVLVTAGIVGGEVGWRGAAVGLALAAIPVPLYAALALWLDRFEREPARVLAEVFLWGALVATFLSMVVNSSVQAAAAGVVGPEEAVRIGAVFSAPVIEELTKGAAFVLLFRLHRHEFDGVTDGVVYAAMVGLGFAMTENVLYYGRALADGDATATFVVRGLLTPFAHPLFTSMTGIGVGLAWETRRAVVRWLAPPAGLLLAMALHALWNLSTEEPALFSLTFAGVMVPSFAGVLLLVRRSLRREAGVLRRQLTPLVDQGLLTRAELARLCVPGGGRRGVRARIVPAEAEAWRRWSALRGSATELAFLRWRRERGLGMDADAALERELLERLHAARGA